MLKKTLFVAIFCASLLLPLSGNLARAQEVTPQNAQIEELKTTLIALLTQMIQTLQTQIQAIIDKQAVTDQTLGAVSTKVDKVVENTKLVVVSTSTPTSPVSLNVTTSCDETGPTTTVSGNFAYALFMPSGYSTDGTSHRGGGQFFSSVSNPNGYVEHNLPGLYAYKAYASASQADDMKIVTDNDYTSEGTIDCQ